jgi:hypothetical protein
MCMHACLTVLGRSVFVGNATTVGSRVNAVVGESRDGMVTESRDGYKSWSSPASSQFLNCLALRHHIGHLGLHVEDICIMNSRRPVSAGLANDLQGG